MGDPKFPRKKYETPSHPWQAERIEREKEILHKYGLTKKREIWRAETILRKLREQARNLRAMAGEKQAEKEKEALLKRLYNLGILPENSTLEDVLSMNVEHILNRRLQTIVYLQGLAMTPKQARQLVVHGHIAIDGRKVTIPSYLVRRNEEEKISYSQKSPLNNELHPARPKKEEILMEKETPKETPKEV